MREIVYNALRTPDGTLLESLHRHDYRTHEDKNGKHYMIDGGTDYVRCSVNGDEEFITVYADEPFEKVRKYAYRLGYGKPGAEDYGTFRKTTLCDMTDDHLEAALDYKGVTKGGNHWQLLLQEKLYRNESCLPNVNTDNQTTIFMQGISHKLTEENQKELYGLTLHDYKIFEIGPTTMIVTRVPGGWIYQYVRLDCQSMWAVFVPFDNEFQPKQQ